MPAIRITSGFRRRLAISFVLVAAAAGGVLAVVGFVLIREYRFDEFREQSADEASLSVLSTPDDLSVADVNQLLAEFQRRGGFETVVLAGDVVFSSTPDLGRDEVPPALVDDVVPGELVRRSTTIDGEPTLVVGGATPSGSAMLFYFFDQGDLLQSISDFRNVLAISWAVTVAVAAMVGRLVARRTLRPVNEAARASQLLAEGLLDTRLEPSSDDEFGRWAASFNTMADALEAKIADLVRAAERERHFTANVAHELRTPLTGMVSAASLLEDSIPALGGDAAVSARLLVDDVHRLKELVSELLELSRFDAGQEQALLEPLSLEQALHAVARSWDATSPVRVEMEDDVVMAADPTRFRRVVVNLISNAVEHGGDGVEVRGRQRDGCAIVEVRDRGPGIEEADLERVFDRFFKSDRSRTASGSGLGLAIASENARLQGGTITARNLDGGGACFAFELAAWSDPDADKSDGDGRAAIVSSAERSGEVGTGTSPG